MKLKLVFDKTGDTLDYKVIHNHELLEFFVNESNSTNNNSFRNNNNLDKTIDKLITDLHWALSKTNEVMPFLTGKEFQQNTDLLDYLNQKFLNKQHAEWVFSQETVLDIDALRFSENTTTARLGNLLHELYPDEIRKIKLAPALSKLGYIYPYEEVNMTVHRLERAFGHLEYSANNKWEVFDNPIKDFYSSSDITNFYFGYTYVGRQYYDKFVNYDTELEFQDHYNYQSLEYSFNLNLSRPQTIPYSKEFLQWAADKNIPAITTSIPIANLIDLEERLFDYRKILLRNSSNYLSLHIF